MNHKNTGFTLLELLVVVGILAALVALALPFYQDYITQSKLVTAQADLQAFQKALALYDHSESKLFDRPNLLPLIGTYLQDYREFEGQENPLDPWGNEYLIRPEAGTILSHGPSGTLHTTDTATRTANPDDLMVTWKPDFFVSSVRKVGNRILEISFSRKVEKGVDITVTVPAPSTIQRVSDTIFRAIYGSSITETEVTVTDSLKSQDGRTLAVSRKPDGSAANKASF